MCEYHYVLVITNYGPVFVTGYENSDHTATWDKGKNPMELSKGVAQDIAQGLTCNGSIAFHVTSPYKYLDQPFDYRHGHFKWQSEPSGDAK